MIQPNFQKIKVNNSIAIGGMVALGKSTLTDALSEAIGANPIREIDSRDTLTTLLLESMYKRDGNNIYAPLFQIYFLLTRYNKYIEHSNDKQTAIFDRTIFEDWLFAQININDPHIFNYYSKLWDARVNQLLYHHGVPKLYVILKGDWNLFIERIQKRARPYEMDNLKENMHYFRTLLNKYEEYLVNVCKNYGIKYIVIDAANPVHLNVELVKVALKHTK